MEGGGVIGVLAGDLSRGVGVGRGPLQVFWCARMSDTRLLWKTFPQLSLQVIVRLSTPPFKVLPGISKQSHPLAGRVGQGI